MLLCSTMDYVTPHNRPHLAKKVALFEKLYAQAAALFSNYLPHVAHLEPVYLWKSGRTVETELSLSECESDESNETEVELDDGEIVLVDEDNSDFWRHYFVCVKWQCLFVIMSIIE